MCLLSSSRSFGAIEKAIEFSARGGHRMKSYRKLAVLLVTLCVSLLVAACGGSSSGSGNIGAPTATTAATATAKPKPTSVPHLDLAYCQQLMLLDEMNTLFKPPASAVTIVPTNGDSGGACNYEVAKANIPLIIYFLEWKGPDPIPQSEIDTILAGDSGTQLTITAATPVTGIGHQAEYVEATGDGGSVHIFYVLEGPFIFDCVTYGFLAAGFLGTQSQLQQCATQVDSRL
jgi:hypothetical protein